MSRPTNVLIVSMSVELLTELLKIRDTDPAAEIRDVRVNFDTGRVEFAVASHHASAWQRERWSYERWIADGA